MSKCDKFVSVKVEGLDISEEIIWSPVLCGGDLEKLDAPPFSLFHKFVRCVKCHTIYHIDKLEE